MGFTFYIVVIVLFLHYVTMSLLKVDYPRIKFIFIYYVNIQCFKIIRTRASKQVLKQCLHIETLGCFLFVCFFTAHSKTLLNEKFGSLSLAI